MPLKDFDWFYARCIEKHEEEKKELEKAKRRR